MKQEVRAAINETPGLVGKVALQGRLNRKNLDPVTPRPNSLTSSLLCTLPTQVGTAAVTQHQTSVELAGISGIKPKAALGILE